MLSARERETLYAVCDAFYPALEPEPGDEPSLHGSSAGALGIAAAAEEAFAALPRTGLDDLRTLLRALEQPLVMLWLVRRARGFRGLTPAERERALLALATSPVAPLRQGFQGLKRLTTFLAYALPGPAGENPAWRAIGYAPSPNPPVVHAAPLRLTTISASVQIDADVCVIGSGAGGGVAAAILAAAGRRVVVLEAGPGLQAEDFDQHELAGMQALYLDRGMTATRDLGVAILAGGALGGGTTVNWQTSLRTPDAVRDEWAEASGCAHFASDDFTRSLDAVSDRIGVGTGESVPNPPNAAILRGAAALGWRSAVLPRNARGCDLAQCGYCVHGCRHGGKQAAPATWLLDAQRAGGAEIVPACSAERVVLSGGRVAGVSASALDAVTGRRHSVVVRAGTVIVAAGSLRSPSILTRSGVALPMIGRNLFLHPTTAVAGVYAERMAAWSGAPQTAICDELAEADGRYGVRLEIAPGHPGLLALATPWHGAREHRRRMQQVASVAPIIALTRDRSSGEVRLRRDGTVAIDYRPGAAELALLRRGIIAAARMHLAAGAREVLALHSHPHACLASDGPAGLEAFAARITASALDRNWSPLFSAHQMGTCRMGSSARSAVCDENGAVFGTRGLYVADASAFPLSSGVNPMLTVMALAHHVATRIAGGR